MVGEGGKAMRAFLQVSNERTAARILRFLQLDPEQAKLTDVCRQAQFFLDTLKEEATPILYGKVLAVNDIGLTLEFNDRVARYVSFIPWHAVHEFKMSTILSLQK